MTPPSLVASGIFGLLVVSAFGYTYYKGVRSCEDSHLVKQLKAKAELQALRLKQFEDATVASKLITEEDLNLAKSQEEKYDKILQAIKPSSGDIVCATDEFLRNLERTRKR